MKFFFPFTTEADQENAYQIAKKVVEANSEKKASARRFLALTYTHDGKSYVAKVGSLDEISGNTVLAIFQAQHDPALFWLYIGDGRGRGEIGGIARAISEHSAIEFDPD